MTQTKLTGVWQSAQEAGVSRAEFYRTFIGEAISSVDGSASRELRAKPVARSLPLRVITADQSFLAFRSVAPHLPFERANTIWRQLQTELTTLTDYSEHTVVAGATHALNTERPDVTAELITTEALNRRRPDVVRTAPDRVRLPQ